MRSAQRHGFTLFEILLVIGLLGVIILLAWPDFTGSARAERLMESARRMQGMVTMCRAEAMNAAVRYRLEFRPDGTVRVLRQADAILAPHLYLRPQVDWANSPLLQDVWVEAVQRLSEGPPPLRIIDDKLVFPDSEVAPVPVMELEEAVWLDFRPDGTSRSLRWVLRDAAGRGLLLTLDGRIGRVQIEPWSAVTPEEIVRPVPLAEEEEEIEFRPEDYR
ncbi:MAG: prepilin-type N-terminal cleavage/methylation domain-containing protein [Phycisphaerales bacterium]|nr:prepilin-type N-terminal cleavage/methylation domain-containing protein [Phycisphaerales bacterium]